MDFLSGLLQTGADIFNSADEARRKALEAARSWLDRPDDGGLKDPGPSFIGPPQDSLTAISDKYYPENIPKPGTPVDQSTWLGNISPQDRALLDTLSFAEGTWKDGKPGYDIAYNFNKINLKEPHPNKVFPGKMPSAASGAYQFMPATWVGSNKGQNVPMTPQNQDNAALLLAKRRGYNSNMTFAEWAPLLAPEWASLPTRSGAGAYPGQGPVAGDGKSGRLNNFYNQRLKLLLGR